MKIHQPKNFMKKSDIDKPPKSITSRRVFIVVCNILVTH